MGGESAVRWRVLGVVPLAVLALGFLVTPDVGALPRPSAADPPPLATPIPARTPPAPPAPLAVISRDVPAFALTALSPARDANDGDYGTAWRSYAAPAWLAYDLSGVPAARRDRVLIAWYGGGGDYDRAVRRTVGPNLPESYAIEANAAPGGGSPPTVGWVTLVRVAGNTYRSRQHLVDLAGFDWVRINIATSDGSAPNGEVALNFDLHDAGPGVEDDWIFYGDSITAAAMATRPVAGVGTFAQLVNANVPTHFPAQENGGISGLKSGEAAAHLRTWLSLFPGRYAVLSYGTNDANRAPAGDAGVADAFYDHYLAMVDAVLAAGKVPVVPKIPWAGTETVRANGPLLNAKLDELYAARPEIIPGPDFWAYFRENPDLISHDAIHPTEQGYAAYRQLWAERMVGAVYLDPTLAAAPRPGWVSAGATPPAGRDSTASP